MESILILLVLIGSLPRVQASKFVGKLLLKKKYKWIWLRLLILDESPYMRIRLMDRKRIDVRIRSVLVCQLIAFVTSGNLVCWSIWKKHSIRNWNLPMRRKALRVNQCKWSNWPINVCTEWLTFFCSAFEQEVGYPKQDARFLDLSIRGVCTDLEGKEHAIEKDLITSKSRLYLSHCIFSRSLQKQSYGGRTKWITLYRRLFSVLVMFSYTNVIKTNWIISSYRCPSPLSFCYSLWPFSYVEWGSLIS